MYRDIAKLILYRDLGEDSILVRLADIARDCKEGRPKESLLRRTNAEIKRILDLSTVCGFDENLWQCYLTWVLMTNENSFTRTCERVGATEGGSVNRFAESDFAVFHQLFQPYKLTLQRRPSQIRYNILLFPAVPLLWQSPYPSFFH